MAVKTTCGMRVSLAGKIAIVLISWRGCRKIPMLNKNRYIYFSRGLINPSNSFYRIIVDTLRPQTITK